MIVAEPAATPVTTPNGDTVAIAFAELLQTPPEAVSDNEITAPAQTLSTPAIDPASGCGLTTTLTVAVADPQLNDVTVYDMVALPAIKPVTMPVPLTVAMPGAELTQAPPAAVSDNVMAAPTQTLSAPVIVPAIGSGLTVTRCVA